MNLPNRLTLMRVLAVPAVVALLCVNTPGCRTAATVLFVLACLTDWLDGHLARSQGIVTDFGKFLDPVADKLLVLCTMIALAGLNQLPAWVCVVVLFRELMVDGLRLVSAQKGIVIAAGKLGKLKTVLQMTLLIVLLVDLPLFSRLHVDWILIAAVVVMTIWSGVDYFIRNRAVFID